MRDLRDWRGYRNLRVDYTWPLRSWHTDLLGDPEVQQMLSGVRDLVILLHGRSGAPGLGIHVAPADVFLAEGDEAVLRAFFNHSGWDSNYPPFDGEAAQGSDAFRAFLRKIASELVEEYDADRERLVDEARTISRRRSPPEPVHYFRRSPTVVSGRWAATLRRGLPLDDMRWDLCEASVSEVDPIPEAPNAADVLRGLAVGRHDGADSDAVAVHAVLLDLKALALARPEGSDAGAFAFVEKMTVWWESGGARDQWLQTVCSYLANQQWVGRSAELLALARRIARLGDIAALPLSQLEKMRDAAATEKVEATARNEADPWVTAMRPELVEERVHFLDDRIFPGGKCWYVREQHSRVRSSVAREVKAQYRILRQELPAERDRRNAALEAPAPLRPHRRITPKIPKEPEDPATRLLRQSQKIRR